MPMGGKLGGDEIATIAAWINSLSPHETLPEAGKHSAAIREPGSPVTDQDRQFWSFVKPFARQFHKPKRKTGGAMKLMPSSCKHSNGRD